MTEELKTKTEEVLLEIINDCLSLKVFVVEQTPLVVQELLMYNFWISLLACLSIPMLTLIFYIISRLSGFYEWVTISDNERTGRGVTIFIVVIMLALFMPMVIKHNLDWFQIWLAPKFYLLEYARGLK
jgi:hypothetical protein